MHHKQNCSLQYLAVRQTYYIWKQGLLRHASALDADLRLTLSLYINVVGDPSNRKPFEFAYPSYVFPLNPILESREGGLLFHLPIVQIFAHFPQAHNNSTKGVVAVLNSVAV